jgi:hypothetical protein
MANQPRDRSAGRSRCQAPGQAPVLMVIGCALLCGVLLLAVRLYDPTPPEHPPGAQLPTAAQSPIGPPAPLPGTAARVPGTARLGAGGDGAPARDAPTDDAALGATAVPEWLAQAVRDPADEDGMAPLVSNRVPQTDAGSFDSRDLAVLQELIDANGLSESTSPFDYDDGDGNFAPWEIGLQVWAGDRLVALVLGPDHFSSFGYALAELPASIGQLDGLRVLDLHAGELRSLPREIGALVELRELHVFRNHLTELPDSIGELAALETLAVGHNQLTSLPPDLTRLTNLQNLYLSDNHLAEMPSFLDSLPLARLDVRHATARDEAPRLAATLAAPLHDAPPHDDSGSVASDVQQ